jgi:chromosome partitioning protein
MIISIAHQKGGVGKSTLVFNLAYYLRELNPVLIDLDLQNTISFANNIRAQNTTPFNIKTIQNEVELKKLIQQSNQNNLFIIDTGGFDSSLNRMSIIAADLIITPVSDKLFEILGLKKFEEILTELSSIKKQPIKAHILLNNISPFTKNLDDISEFIQKSNNFILLKNILRQRADVTHSSAKGLSVAEYSNQSKAHSEFFELSIELLNILKTYN